MNKKIFTILLLFITSLSFAGEIRDKAEKIILNEFPNCDLSVSKLFVQDSLKLKSEIFAQQRFFGKFIYYYSIKSGQDTVGFACIDNVLGKVKPITYLVIFNKDLSIRKVDIIKYREQYGGAISEQAWLSQFKQKEISQKINLDENIDGISGATISVKAIIAGIKRLLFLLNNLEKYDQYKTVSVK